MVHAQSTETGRRYTRKSVEALDEADKLAHYRQKFALPCGVYLDGNSLGALPLATSRRIQDVVQREWGQDLIESWTKNSWIHLARRVGAKLAQLIGADSDEVVVCDSTSINVFKCVSAALDLQADKSRHIIVSERHNFPTDLYMLEGLNKIRGGGYKLVLLDDPSQLTSRPELMQQVAVVLLSHVSFCTGRMLDMKLVTKAVHQGGGLMVWDLAHSAGAVPVELGAAEADFALGCGYKYLNGGPGAPAFLYVAKRHQDKAVNPLSGWFGHKKAFAFTHSYEPADGIQRFLTGTTPVLGLSALEVGVDTMLETNIDDLRQKSVALTTLFIELVEQECHEWGFQLGSPRDPELRGSQVNILHKDGYAIMQALIARHIVGDFRAPDIMRFGFTPLYTSFIDVWKAVQVLKEIMQTSEWDCEDFKAVKSVT